MLALLLAPQVGALLSASAGQRGAHRFAAPPSRLRTRPVTLITYNDFVNEIRAFKGALRRALAAEDGMLSEDTLACIAAMSEVNPSAPDPATDDDLWTGEFELSSRIFVPTAAAPLEICSGTVCVGFELTESFELTADVFVMQAGGMAPAAPNARLVLSGSIAAEDAETLRFSATAAWSASGLAPSTRLATLLQRPVRLLSGRLRGASACSMLARSLSARAALRGAPSPRGCRGERLRRCSGACPKMPVALFLTIQAPRLSLELLEEDAELLAACATAAQTLLTSVDKVRPPLPACPSSSGLWRPRRVSAHLLWPNREQVSDRAIEGSGEAGISLKVLYLDQNLHMLQPGWDSDALPIVLSRVEA